VNESILLPPAFPRATRPGGTAAFGSILKSMFIISPEYVHFFGCSACHVASSPHIIKKATVLPCIGKGSKSTMGKKSKESPRRDKASSKSLSPGGTKVCLVRQ
jgi:hypothetical protein